MFESICIRRQRPLFASGSLDLAFLAEAMVFYQQVHLIADMDILHQLAVECGPALVNEFIEEGFLKISYLEKRSAIQNYRVGAARELHSPVTIVDTKGLWRLEKVAPEIFSKAAGGPGYGRQLGRRFAELVPTIDISNALLLAVREDFADEKYIEKAIVQLLNAIAPTYRLPQDYCFHISKESGKFRIDTNLDFLQANESFRQHWQLTGDFLAPGSLLTYIFEARSDLFFASRENSEIATHLGGEAIINVKFREILSKAKKSESDMETFQTLVLANSHEIGESITLGYRSWHDLLTLLKNKNTQKFKDWLHKKNADASLIHEYIKVLEKDNPWIASPPAKMLRFLITTSGGFVFSPLASIGLSGADAFLVDRLLGGWKPNQFVNGPLKTFARLD